jgi:hypothetical protein
MVVAAVAAVAAAVMTMMWMWYYYSVKEPSEEKSLYHRVDCGWKQRWRW